MFENLLNNFDETFFHKFCHWPVHKISRNKYFKLKGKAKYNIIIKVNCVHTVLQWEYSNLNMNSFQIIFHWESYFLRLLIIHPFRHGDF